MIRIIADSTCDLSREDCEALGIELVPLTIHFGNEEYKDGIDISRKEFYDKLRKADKLPTTSQANPYQFGEVFAKHAANGDNMLVITISSKLSATYQSAAIAAETDGAGRVYIVDSGSASLGAAILIFHAAKLRGEGKLDAAAIADELRAISKRLIIYAVVDTIKYLKMGGRLSGGKALAAEIIGITPVIGVEDGVVSAVGKARGENGRLRALARFIEEAKPDGDYGVCFASADADDKLPRYIDTLYPLFPEGTAIYSVALGSVIGTHSGPGALGVAFVRRK